MSSVAIEPGHRSKLEPNAFLSRDGQPSAGLIPENWRVASIAAIKERIIDYRGRTPRKLGMEWGNGDIPALSARNVKMGYLDFNEETYFGSEGLYARWMLAGDTKKDDLVLTTEAPLGNVALIPDKRKYILSQRTILLKTNPKFATPQYLLQAMMSDSFQKLLSDNATGSTATGIKRTRLEQLEILLPPVWEQAEIAAALTDVDGLISALDKLISKKRAIKQATMQQLLAGKTRLPGFSSEWRRKRVGELAECTAGGTPSTIIPQYWGGAIRWMSSGELHLKMVYEVEGRITAEGLRDSSARMLPPNSVLVGLAGQGKTRGTVAINKVELATNQSIAAILAGAGFSSDYLYYNLDARYDELRVLSAGDGGRGGLNLRIIRSVEVPLPELEEQRAIAAVLSDMDAEIAALQRRRDKTKAIKQGMMQALLTGRVRLVKRAAGA